MKTLTLIVTAGALLILVPVSSLPVMAQQYSGGGTTNIWSSAQGTSYTYGAASGFSNSSSESVANAGAMGLTASALNAAGASMTSAITISNAGTTSTGGGYSQVQTSGYAGGSFSGFGARTH